MERKRRRILCIGVVAALLLSIVGTGVAVPQPVQKGNAIDNAAKALFLGGAVDESKGAGKKPVIVVHSGHGFAIDGDEFHVLRVNILRARRIQPSHIRDLIEGNMSIEDIRAEVEKGALFYRGHMRLGENHYRLVNMSVEDTDGNRAFDADVVGPLRKNAETNETVGHISMTVMRYEGVWIGEGELTMTEGEYKGDYTVLLDVLPPRRRR